MNDKKQIKTSKELFEQISRLSAEAEWTDEELRAAIREEGVDPDEFVLRVRSAIAPLLREDSEANHVAECVPTRNYKQTLPLLLKRLQIAGIDRKFLRRLLTRPLLEGIDAFIRGAEDKEETLILESATAISRVFGWELNTLMNPSITLELNSSAMAAVRFKLPSRANEQRLSAYTVYAHMVAMILLDATVHLPRKPIPSTAEEIREAIKSSYGSITFESALRYIWSLGIPVLPLSDPGAFHAACWRVDGRNVIALKQRVRSAARWLFDLIHDFDHARSNPDQPDLGVIDEDETLEQRRNSPEEKAANRLAGEVVLDGRAEELTQMCVTAARNSVEKLKRIVPQIATREGVAADSLANYLAFRLSLQGINWWPTATGLQMTEVDPWRIARDVLFEHVDFSRLNEFDRNLLEQALIDEAELEG